MPYVGGDITEITYNHPVFGSGTIYCKANESGTLERGGYRSNDDDNSVTGDGQFIDQINRRRGKFEAPPIAWDMTDKDEQEKLSNLAESPILADWTINHISGAIYGGKGKPVGDLPGDTNTAQVTLVIAFEGKVKKIS